MFMNVLYKSVDVNFLKFIWGFIIIFGINFWYLYYYFVVIFGFFGEVEVEFFRIC